MTCANCVGVCTDMRSSLRTVWGRLAPRQLLACRRRRRPSLAPRADGSALLPARRFDTQQAQCRRASRDQAARTPPRRLRARADRVRPLAPPPGAAAAAAARARPPARVADRAPGGARRHRDAQEAPQVAAARPVNRDLALALALADVADAI